MVASSHLRAGVLPFYFASHCSSHSYFDLHFYYWVIPPPKTYWDDLMNEDIYHPPSGRAKPHPAGKSVLIRRLFGCTLLDPPVISSAMTTTGPEPIISVETKQNRAKLNRKKRKKEQKRLELEAKRLNLFKNILPHRASMEVRSVSITVNKGKLW